MSIAATALAAGGCASGALQPDDPVRVTNPRTIGKTQLVGERIPIGIPEDYKPCIARLPGGELLLVAFHAPRKGGVPEEYTFLYRSSDGGRSWSQRRKLDVLGREAYFSVTSDGTLFISTHLLPKARGNREGHPQSYLYRSTDQGDSWEAHRIGFEDLQGMDGPGTVATGRNVLELESGVLVFAVGGQGGHEFLWRSEDGGKTWDKSLACQFEGVDELSNLAVARPLRTPIEDCQNGCHLQRCNGLTVGHEARVIIVSECDPSCRFCSALSVAGNESRCRLVSPPSRRTNVEPLRVG